MFAFTVTPKSFSSTVALMVMQPKLILPCHVCVCLYSSLPYTTVQTTLHQFMNVIIQCYKTNCVVCSAYFNMLLVLASFKPFMHINNVPCYVLSLTGLLFLIEYTCHISIDSNLVIRIFAILCQVFSGTPSRSYGLIILCQLIQ